MSDVTGKPNKVALWCVPRSLSSVFCKCVANVENSRIIFEYYTAACHSGPEQTITHPGTPPGKIFEPEFTYKYVKEQLEQETTGIELYFLKDMAHGLAGDFTRLPDGYQHTFLMRHPARVFKSFQIMSKKLGVPKMKQYMPDGCGYKELWELHEYVTKVLKQKSVVLDADDLKVNPEVTVRRYCEATGIPFQESMLSWEPESPNPSTWKAPASSWFANQMFGIFKAAFESTGFVAGNPAQIVTEDLSAEVMECVEFSMPYYEKLREVCLKP